MMERSHALKWEMHTTRGIIAYMHCTGAWLHEDKNQSTGKAYQPIALVQSRLII